MYLGVDAGGSHCRARLVASDGTVLGTGCSGPANTRLGAAAVMASIRSSVLEALRSAGRDEESRAEVSMCVGLAGHSRSRVVASLERDSFCRSFRRVSFTSDILIAHVGAHRGRDGGSVLVGTGTVAMATRDEETLQLGGKGFPVSDLGSGAHMGLLALQRSLLAAEGVGADSAMTREIVATEGLDSKLVENRLDEMGPSEYAALAPLVVRNAEAGDAVAVEIVRECAAHVSGLLTRVAQFGVERVVLGGGLAPTMHQWIPAAQSSWLASPFGDALDGAIAIADESIP